MKTTERLRTGTAKHLVKALMFPILCLCLISVPLSYPRADQRKHVLVLHSYHQGLGWTDRITQGIESALNDSDQEIDIHFEYMDAKRIYNEQHFQNLYELYRHKFRNCRFDVVMSSDNHAFNFLLVHHRELFPDTPIVFCGVNGFEDSMLLGHNLITGVAELDDFKSTIDVALQLQPNTEQVFVIVDKTLTGSIGERLMKKVIPHYKDTLRFTFWKDLDIAQVQERAGKLTPDSIAFLYTFTTDRSGNVFTLEKSCELISQYCAVPIYAAADAYIGHGIIGGMLTSGYAQGKKIGEMALRIFRGEKVENISVLKKSPNRYMFDYQQMQRFGIKPASLPEGSTIINIPHSFYSEHKGLIWSAIISIAGLVLIIVILSTNIITRIRSEKALRESEERYRSLVESTEDSVYLVDREHRYLFMNKKHLSRFGLPSDKVIGRGYGEFHSERETRDFIKKVNKVFETGNSLSYEYRSEGDGRYFLRTLSPVKDPDGRTTAVTMVSKDITEHKQAEKVLKESEKRLRFLSSQLITAQETERKRISLELHDEMGQALTAININLRSIEKELPLDLTPLIKEKIAETYSLADQASEQIRELSHYLRPSMLDDLGLVPTLRWYLDEYKRRTDLDVIFEHTNFDVRNNPELETAIYRVVQEALNNIVKHAKASKVWVHLDRKEKEAAVVIKDNGKGFEANEVLAPGNLIGGIGILGMQERVNILGGRFSIQSSKEHGTSVSVEIPLN